jgi:hypothetical protein
VQPNVLPNGALHSHVHRVRHGLDLVARRQQGPAPLSGYEHRTCKDVDSLSPSFLSSV